MPYQVISLFSSTIREFIDNPLESYIQNISLNITGAAIIIFVLKFWPLIMHWLTFKIVGGIYIRKMMINEQFHKSEIAKEYNKRYFDSQIDSIEALMKEFIKQGKITAKDARILAVDFISPVILYINVCDREPKRKKEALNAIECHIKEFNKKYIVN